VLDEMSSLKVSGSYGQRIWGNRLITQVPSRTRNDLRRPIRRNVIRFGEQGLRGPAGTAGIKQKTTKTKKHTPKRQTLGGRGEQEKMGRKNYLG